MREIPVTGLRHPLEDAATDAYLLTETRAPVVFLTAARVNLLTKAAAADRPVVLATDELSSLTPAQREAVMGGNAAALYRLRERRGRA